MSIPIVAGLPAYDAHDDNWNMAEFYRQPYVEVKYRIASIYKPKRICEIGVYSGIAAMCFLSASPDAEYFGIDSCESEKTRGIVVVENTLKKLRELGYRADVMIANSQELTSLPNGPFDFIHVDGDHSPEGAYHDTKIAWQALTADGVVLVDNCHNMQVCRGVTAALHDAGTDLLDWFYYPESVGTMVVQKKPQVR